MQLLVAEPGFKLRHLVFKVCFVTLMFYCTEWVDLEFSPRVCAREEETKARTLR